MFTSLQSATLVRNGARATALVGFAVLALVALLAYVVVLSPRFAQAADISAQADDQAELNNATQAQINTLTTQLTNIDAAIGQARDLSEQLPPDAALSTTLTQIVAAASTAGITEKSLNAVTSAAPVLTSGDGSATLPGQGGLTVASMQMIVTADATLPQTVAFVKALTSMKRLYLLSSLTSSYNPDTRNYTTTITGRMLLLKQTNLDTVIAQLNQLKGSLGITTNTPASGAPTPPTVTPTPTVG